MISSIRCAPVIRQGEAKSRAAIDNTFRPDFSSMALDNALHGCQPDARAAKFAWAWRPLNGMNKLASRGKTKPRPAAPTKIMRAAVDFGNAPNSIPAPGPFAGNFQALPNK